MASRYRPRKQFKFFLYRDKDDESRLIEFIEYCKSTRHMARVIRDGIRLMWSLGEGKTDVLYELFPWLQQQMKPTPSTHTSDNSDLERQIADLKRIILQQGGISLPELPANYPLMKAPAAPIVAAKVAPIPDASAIADNFLNFIQ